MKLKTPRSDLLAFGFIARDYKKDYSALAELQKEDDETMSQFNDIVSLINES